MAREPKVVRPLPMDLVAAGQNFRDRLGLATPAPAQINPNAVTAYARPNRLQVGLSGVAGDDVVGAIGGVRGALRGEGFAAGRDNTMAAYAGARQADPAQFSRDQGTGLAASLGIGGAGGVLARSLTKAATRPGVLPAIGNQIGNAMSALKPAAALFTARNAAEQAADPGSETRTGLRTNMAQAGSNLAAGDVPAAAGSVTRAAVEGALDFAKNSAPLPSRDAMASFFGGAAGAGPSTIVTGPASTPVAPATRTPADQSDALNRQLAMFGQAPGQRQMAPQAPAALKDDLVASLDGLSIRQVLELAKVMPTPADPAKPPSARDMFGYEIFNMINENAAAEIGNAATDEDRAAARQRQLQMFQLMFNPQGGMMAGFE